MNLQFFEVTTLAPAQMYTSFILVWHSNKLAVLDYPLQILDHKSETPISSFNYPKLRLRCRSGLFNLSLGCFTFCNPRLFKSWDYLNLLL